MKTLMILLFVFFVLSGKSQYIDESPRAVICDTFFVAENTQFNLWYDALIPNVSQYRIKAYTSTSIANITEDMERCFRFSPVAAQVGNTYTLTIEIYKGFRKVQTLTTKLKVISRSAGTGSKEWCLVGNSLIANSADHIKIVNDSINTNTSIVLTSVGMIGTVGYYREGYSGRTWSWFCTNESSPFVIGGKIDLDGWWTDSLGRSDSLEAIIIQSGINDMFSGKKSQSDIDAAVVYAKQLCDSFLTQWEDIQIVIALPPIASNKDAWSENYDSPSTYSLIEYEQNMRNYWRTMLNEFDGYAYHNQVDIIMSGLTVDRVNGYPITATPISSRYSTNYNKITNAVHPYTSGYQQLGDNWLGILLNKLNK